MCRALSSFPRGEQRGSSEIVFLSDSSKDEWVFLRSASDSWKLPPHLFFKHFLAAAAVMCHIFKSLVCDVTLFFYIEEEKKDVRKLHQLNLL